MLSGDTGSYGEIKESMFNDIVFNKDLYLWNRQRKSTVDN